MREDGVNSLDKIIDYYQSVGQVPSFETRSALWCIVQSVEAGTSILDCLIYMIDVAAAKEDWEPTRRHIQSQATQSAMRGAARVLVILNKAYIILRHVNSFVADVLRDLVNWSSEIIEEIRKKAEDALDAIGVTSKRYDFYAGSANLLKSIQGCTNLSITRGQRYGNSCTNWRTVN